MLLFENLVHQKFNFKDVLIYFGLQLLLQILKTLHKALESVNITDQQYNDIYLKFKI